MPKQTEPKLATPEAENLPPDRSIGAAIQAVLAREALANERKLAYVRAVVVGISALLDVAVFFFPAPLIGKASVPHRIALFALAASALSFFFFLLLRSAAA